jgi:hypothetical protein
LLGWCALVLHSALLTQQQQYQQQWDMSGTMGMVIAISISLIGVAQQPVRLTRIVTLQ